MQEMNYVEVVVEKEQYANDGVHKGMDGWICDPRNINGQWLVSFDQYGELPEIACIAVKEEDLRLMSTEEIIAKNEVEEKKARQRKSIFD